MSNPRSVIVPRDPARQMYLIDPGQNPLDQFEPDDEVRVDRIREMFGTRRIEFDVYRARPITKDEKTAATDLVMYEMGYRRAKPDDAEPLHPDTFPGLTPDLEQKLRDHL